MDTETQETPDPFADKVGIQARPTWLRILLLIVVLLLAGAAFYMTNQITIEQIQNQ